MNVIILHARPTEGNKLLTQRNGDENKKIVTAQPLSYPLSRCKQRERGNSYSGKSKLTAISILALIAGLALA
jgi:hypothetical protein